MPAARGKTEQVQSREGGSSMGITNAPSFSDPPQWSRRARAWLSSHACRQGWAFCGLCSHPSEARGHFAAGSRQVQIPAPKALELRIKLAVVRSSHHCFLAEYVADRMGKGFERLERTRLTLTSFWKCHFPPHEHPVRWPTPRPCVTQQIYTQEYLESDLIQGLVPSLERQQS